MVVTPTEPLQLELALEPCVYPYYSTCEDERLEYAINLNANNGRLTHRSLVWRTSSLEPIPTSSKQPLSIRVSQTDASPLQDLPHLRILRDGPTTVPTASLHTQRSNGATWCDRTIPTTLDHVLECKCEQLFNSEFDSLSGSSQLSRT